MWDSRYNRTTTDRYFDLTVGGIHYVMSMGFDYTIIQGRELTDTSSAKKACFLILSLY